MSQDKRRHERIPISEPASLKTGDDEYEGTLKDVSQGGAAVEFDFPMGKSSINFDIGNNLEVTSESVDHRKGRVVRHYDKGFGVKFD